MRAFGRAAMILALLVAPVPLFAAGALKGKVNYQGKPLEGAVVSLYASYEGGFRGKADYESPPTGKDGAFEVAPAKGRYFLIARKIVNGKPQEPLPGDYYAYYGGNPVVVGEGETIHIGINCSPVVDLGPRRRPGGTGIRGKVLADGKPLDRARVTLYQDGETIFRGIGYASVLTGPEGDFSFNLEPGSYYVVARKRAGDDRMGPLGGGDFFGFAHDNPVRVERDIYAVVSIHSVNKLVKVKEGGQEVTLGGTVKSGETVVEGVVRGRDGKPVAGVYAHAYRDPMMTQKPDFISGKTGPDGAYVIHFSEGGEYFLGARNTMGGPAERGDLLGKYDGNEDHSVRIRTGEKRKGIDIVVEPVE
jgi:hypothetical protein